jgi:hypothetical protein
MFQNRMLRRMFGPKSESVIGGWRKVHSEGLHSLCTSPDIISVIKEAEMGMGCRTHGSDEK